MGFPLKPLTLLRKSVTQTCPKTSNMGFHSCNCTQGNIHLTKTCWFVQFVSEFFHGQRNENFYASLYAGLCYESHALVVRIDPRRVYLKNPDDAELNAVKVKKPGPPGEGYAWYQCTVPILSVKEHLSKEGIEVRM